MMRLKKMKRLDIFITISLSCTIVFLFLLIITGGDIATWLVMENNYDSTFTDHFRHVCFASDMEHFYFNTIDATFPPFAYLLYHLLVMINPPEQPWGILDWDAVIAYKYNMLVYIMLTILLVLIFKLITDKCLPQEGVIKTTVFVSAILLSAPFMSGAIERGNIAFLTAVMLLIALYLKDRDSVICREAALLLIAMAAGLKLYPAVVGFIYVKEKRWKEGVRLLIYGLIFFFVPFAFVGGIPALIRYFKVLFFFETQGYCSWTNIRNFLLSVSRVLGQYENSPYFVKYFKIAENLYLILCLLSLFKTGDKWKQTLYTSGAMALYVPYSYRYVSCYMVIPLVFYLMEREEDRKMIYCILFALTFTVPFYGYFTGIGADFFIFLPIYIMMAYAFWEEWISPLLRSNKLKEQLINNF
ncbi:MAG TPA: hypothetical protein DCW47_07590 [Lachnospiraceae bacterium]|nr:hypothetical protein [Lachnospiraceae bacterium]